MDGFVRMAEKSLFIALIASVWIGIPLAFITYPESPMRWDAAIPFLGVALALSLGVAATSLTFILGSDVFRPTPRK